MKPNSKLVMLVLAHVCISSVQALEDASVDSKLMNILQQEMTPEAKQAMADFAAEADQTGRPVLLSADEELWNKAGFRQMTKDMRTVFCQCYKHYGREIVFTTDGLIVHPTERAIVALRNRRNA